ncbi:4'-phosphopantetheinyl transferase [Oxalobacteraceae bacterium A2-2]
MADKATEGPLAPPGGRQRLLPPLCHEQDGQFFAGAAGVLPRGSRALPYYLALFRADRFAPELFQTYGIDFPPHIRKSVLKRQAEFFAGRLCARAILENYGHGRHVVAVGQHREPLWPQGFIGSITHSGHYAAAIACEGRDIAGIGIDIETIIASEARQAMTELVVCAEELRFLRMQVGALDIDSLLTLVFSAKESFFKAAFPLVGRYFDFDAVKVVGFDEQHGRIQLRCVQQLGERLGPGQEHEVYFDFLGDSSVLTAVLLTREAAAAAMARAA